MLKQGLLLLVSCTCCSYEYDEVSFLLEVYGHLEEPDGIAGARHLRWPRAVTDWLMNSTFK